MILQCRVCQPVPIPLFILALLLGFLLAGVSTSTTPETQKSDTNALHSVSATLPPTASPDHSTEQPAVTVKADDPSKDSATSPSDTASASEPSPKIHSTETSADAEETTSRSPGAHTRGQEDSTTEEEVTSTAPVGQKSQPTNVVIFCFVLLFVVIIIICLYVILRKRRKSSYSLTSKSPDSSGVPLKDVKE